MLETGGIITRVWLRQNSNPSYPLASDVHPHLPPPTAKALPVSHRLSIQSVFHCQPGSIFCERYRGYSKTSFPMAVHTILPSPKAHLLVSLQRSLVVTAGLFSSWHRPDLPNQIYAGITLLE
jgi:hypothetical protein